MRAPTNANYYFTASLFGDRRVATITFGTMRTFAEHAMVYYEPVIEESACWVWPASMGKLTSKYDPKMVYAASDRSDGLANQELKMTTQEIAEEWIKRHGVTNDSPIEVIYGTGDRSGQTCFRVTEYKPAKPNQAERYAEWIRGVKPAPKPRFKRRKGSNKGKDSAAADTSVIDAQVAPLLTKIMSGYPARRLSWVERSILLQWGKTHSMSDGELASCVHLHPGTVSRWRSIAPAALHECYIDEIGEQAEALDATQQPTRKRARLYEDDDEDATFEDDMPQPSSGTCTDAEDQAQALVDLFEEQLPAVREAFLNKLWKRFGNASSPSLSS